MPTNVESEEIEISLFGPGYGECVLIHLGCGEWIVIDSCIREGARKAQALEYLSKMGVDPAQAIKLIIATHWHDDHMRGLAQIVEACPNAKFVCASALTKKEFITAMARFQTRNALASGTGVGEMFEVLKLLAERGQTPLYASANAPVYKSPAVEAVAGGSCIVTALSPSSKQIELFWREIAAQMPGHMQTRRRASAKSPNHVAVAILVSVGPNHILLGSDLEDTADPEMGWKAIVGSDLRPSAKAQVFKIPHHGSDTAHNDDVWAQMVDARTFAILTPFQKGKVLLPTAKDVERISQRAGKTVITSSIDRKKAADKSPLARRAAQLAVGKSLRIAQTPMGFVRLRKKLGASHAWRIAKSQDAIQIPNGK